MPQKRRQRQCTCCASCNAVLPTVCISTLAVLATFTAFASNRDQWTWVSLQDKLALQQTAKAISNSWIGNAHIAAVPSSTIDKHNLPNSPPPVPHLALSPSASPLPPLLQATTPPPLIPPLPLPPAPRRPQPSPPPPLPSVVSKHAPNSVQRATVLYGIETCNSTWFISIVEAQLRTWAKRLPRERLIFVGGAHDDAKEGISEVPLACKDKQEDLWCKEGILLMRAIERAKQLTTPVDWVAVSQDDKYIWTDNVENKLASYDASKPQIFGGFGCGMSWQYQPASKGGTVPRPASYIQPPFSCDAVWTKGALCGGGVYFVSRGAMELLLKPGQTWKEFMEEMRVSSKGRGAASDVFASCMFHSRKLPMWSEHPVTNHLLDPRSPLDKLPLAMHLSMKKELIPDYLDALDKAEFNHPAPGTPGFFGGRR